MHRRQNTVFRLLPFILAAPLFAFDGNRSVDATAIPFEELLQTDYIPASQIARQVSNAASAVSIVTAQEIKEYGYRTLGEILGSMRGLHVFQDYEYTFLGGRGYGAPGDYAGRIVLFIDGYRANDTMYGQALLGEDGLLDAALIERVEYIPGGGSSGYGNGVLLGAINVITKNGGDIGGTQVALGYGSRNTQTRRATFGKTFDNGADLLVSLSAFDTDGRDFSYTTDTQRVSQKGQNSENGQRFFIKASHRNLTLEGALAIHEKELPSYPAIGIISEESLGQMDTSGFIRLKYDRDLADALKLSASVWHGEYRYEASDPVYFSNDGINYLGVGQSKWEGGDLGLIGTWFENHTLSFGVEHRRDFDLYWQDQYHDPSTGETETETYPSASRRTQSAYLYDDYALTQTLGLNFGVRQETDGPDYEATSPQAALIWHARESTLLKLSTGETNRRATILEGSQTKPERARTTELVVEEQFGRNAKLLASFFHYHTAGFSGPGIEAEGAEAEFEKHWDAGLRLKTGYAYQKAFESKGDIPLVNTPKHLAKLNLSLPLNGERLRAGLETHYVGKRPKEDGKNAKAYSLTHLTLLSREWIPNADLSFKISNLANENYGDVVWEQYNGDLLYPQERRAFRFELEYRFQ